MKHFAAGLLLGAPWCLAFAPFSWWWVGLLLLAGLYFSIRQRWVASTRQAMALGMGFGVSSFGVGVSWLFTSMHTYGGLPAALAMLAVLLFAGYLALFGALACVAFYKAQPVLHRHTWLAPCVWAGLWTACSALRATLFTGFAWLDLGDALVDSPFAWMLAWVGNYGALLLVLIGLMAVVEAWLQKNQVRAMLRPLVIVGMFVVAGGVMRSIPLKVESTTPMTVVGVQTQVDQSLKFDPNVMAENMMKVFQMADLGVSQLPENGILAFPETVVPLLWDQAPDSWRQQFRSYAGKKGRQVVLGAALHQNGQFFNSVVLLKGTETKASLVAPITRHDKRHLVPFGEFVPWGFHWFVNMMQIPLGDFTSAQGPMIPFQWGKDNWAASAVCYEDTFSAPWATLLSQATQEPTVMLNLSNLAWFGPSWALDQHAQMGRTRAVEHHKPGVRVTNTGVSGVFDANGQWIKRIETGQAIVWQATFEGSKGLTPFALFGARIWYALWVFIAVLFGVMAWVQRAHPEIAETSKPDPV